MKSVLKTLSLSFVVLFAAAMASASPQGPLRHPAMASEPAGSAPSLSEIDEGWARLLDAALAKRAPGSLAVPGAIVIPPFKSFAPYRTDLPRTATALRGSKAAGATKAVTQAGGSVNHD